MAWHQRGRYSRARTSTSTWCAACPQGRPEASLTAEAVVAYCRSRLAGFKTPKHVVLVEELPKNPSGKLLKRDLRERYADLAQAPRG